MKHKNECPEKDISIIIVNYNTCDILNQCLQSIRNGQWKSDIEIIVIDNNSTDGSQELLHQQYPDVTLIANDSNAGYTRANNQGFEIAKGRFLLLLNSDTIVKADSLDAMVEYLEAYKDIGVLGCKLLNEDGSLQKSCGVYPSLKTEASNKLYLHRWLPNSRWAKQYKLADWDYNSERDVDWVTGAAMMIRRNVLDAIGRLDENIYMFYEDVDFCLRARNAGWRIRYIPDAEIVHLWGGSWKKDRKQTIINTFDSTCYFFRKHYRPSQVKALKILVLIETMIRIPIFTFLALWQYEKRDQWINRLEGYEELVKRWRDA